VFKILTSKVLVVFMTAAMVNLVVGCNSQRIPEAPAENERLSQMQQEEVQMGKDDAGAQFLGSDTPNGQGIIFQTANSSLIKPYMENFETLGYSFAPGYSFVVEGCGSPEADSTDTIHVQIVDLAMVNTADTTTAVYIRYVKCELGGVIAPYMLSFVEPEEPGFEYVTDGVWQKNYPATVTVGVKSHEPMAATIYDFLDCVATGTAGGCAGAIMGCAFTGPAYPACVATGCVMAFFVSVATCALTVLDDDPMMHEDLNWW
jgi:hypothetical protein